MVPERNEPWFIPCTRRAALQGAVGLLAASVLGRANAAPTGSHSPIAANAFAALEKQSQGRLGVAIIDTATGTLSGHRRDERFPMCSTFKVLAVAAILARVDRGDERLERRVVYTANDLLEHAPVTRARATEGGLSVSELCEATLVTSDNTAANLLLASFGGPVALTAYAHTLGDDTTRLDRNEPSLNTATPGDERDTTTPSAMARTLEKLVLGSALSTASREKLSAWMAASTTGLARLRAGLPSEWRAADRTGSGEHNTTNDIAILWPPQGKPIVIAVYLTASTAPPDVRNGVFADLARQLSGQQSPRPT